MENQEEIIEEKEMMIEEEEAVAQPIVEEEEKKPEANPFAMPEEKFEPVDQSNCVVSQCIKELEKFGFENVSRREGDHRKLPVKIFHMETRPT